MLVFHHRSFILRAAHGLLLAGLLALAGSHVGAEEASWGGVTKDAKGQTVYWNAWGGDTKINAYIAWVGDRVLAEYGVTLVHVKLADTAEAVSRVLAEKSAGRNSDGTIDLIWINGENFASMKKNDLLYGPFVERLPNYALVDLEMKPTTQIDFTLPVEGLEAPWGMAKLNFIYDSARVETPPHSIPALLDWAKAHPGRFTYPAPPDFFGSTFLKQVLYDLAPDVDRLLAPPANDAAFAATTDGLWNYLDALHPVLWRGGTAFPASGPQQIRLLNDGEVDFAISFTPSAAASKVESGELPASVRVLVLENGTIGNTHFVAIPFNARAKEGAMVVANFLMSAEAQARKQDLRYWGDDTVLSMAKLSADERQRFEMLPRHAAQLSPEELGVTLPEPHPDWMTRIEDEWQRRYAR